MSEEDKSRHEDEYQALLALYMLLLSANDEESYEEALYNLAYLRSDYAFGHVLRGLEIDREYALSLLKNIDDYNLTQHDKEMRRRLIAAIDNLIDFAVCEEYQLYDETKELQEELGVEDIDYDELLLLCEKYNDKYAAIENSDIAYAGVIAARWMRYSVHDMIVYWTQNDGRVRPWHKELHGYTASVDEFPSWMIPPIEYNCRCYLELLEIEPFAKLTDVKAKAKTIQKPKELNDVYSESLATCGRIFGPSHPYFEVKSEDKPMLKRIVERIRTKYYG